MLIRGLVVPLLYRTTYYSVTKSVNSRRSIIAGEIFQQSFGALTPPYQFQLQRPSGQEEKITAQFRGSDVIIKTDNNLELGNYSILQSNNLLLPYSVNHSRLESAQDYYFQDELDKIYPNAQWITDRENLVEQVEAGRFGRELWPYLMGLVILLVFLEMALAYTGSSKQINFEEKPRLEAN
jgi:hypothetical protein